jgi:hypothetical protein
MRVVRLPPASASRHTGGDELGIRDLRNRRQRDSGFARWLVGPLESARICELIFERFGVHGASSCRRRSTLGAPIDGGFRPFTQS